MESFGQPAQRFVQDRFAIGFWVDPPIDERADQRYAEIAAANFTVEFEYKMSPGGNSGVYLRCPPEGHPSSVAMEIQLLDDSAPQHANMASNQFTGSIYKLVAPSRRNARPLGEWNHMRITAQGDHITVVHNEVTILDVNGHSCPEILKRSPRGAIGLQAGLHGCSANSSSR